MKRGNTVFPISIAVALTTLFPLQVLSEVEGESLFRSDKRLAQTVSWQGTNQPVRRALESLSAQLKVPLRADSKTASLRLTVSSPHRVAHEFLGLIAKTLNARWQREGEGYLLSRPATSPQLSQAEKERLHQEFHKQQLQDLVQERRRQRDEFRAVLLRSSRLTDGEVLALAARYPLVRQQFENSKLHLMCARLLTWLDKDQLQQAMNDAKWGARLIPDDVRKTGSDYNLGFSYISIRVRPDLAMPVQCNIVWMTKDSDQSLRGMVVAF